jgi:hypothetical protein
LATFIEQNMHSDLTVTGFAALALVKWSSMSPSALSTGFIGRLLSPTTSMT